MWLIPILFRRTASARLWRSSFCSAVNGIRAAFLGGFFARRDVAWAVCIPEFVGLEGSSAGRDSVWEVCKPDFAGLEWP